MKRCSLEFMNVRAHDNGWRSYTSNLRWPSSQHFPGDPLSRSDTHCWLRHSSRHWCRCKIWGVDPGSRTLHKALMLNINLHLPPCTPDAHVCARRRAVYRFINRLGQIKTWKPTWLNGPSARTNTHKQWMELSCIWQGSSAVDRWETRLEVTAVSKRPVGAMSASPVKAFTVPVLIGCTRAWHARACVGIWTRCAHGYVLIELQCRSGDVRVLKGGGWCSDFNHGSGVSGWLILCSLFLSSRDSVISWLTSAVMV